MMNKKAGLPVLVLLAAVIMAGCAQDAEQPSQPKAGVLTVTDAEDGVFYEADVYDYSEAVTDAADLNGIMSEFEPDGTGTGSTDNGTLEIDLETPDGEVFTADGKFLVALKDAEDDSAPLKYKTFVRFTGGRAAVKYSTMKTAASGTDEPSVSMYTVTFHTNGGTPDDFTQEVQSGGKAAIPTPPTREGYTLDGWYKDEALNTPYNFDSTTVSADITLYAKWKPLTFAVLLMDMAVYAAANTDKTYTLPSGSETYTSAITPLTMANSPSSVVIDGGGRVVTGSTNRITIGEGVTLTLKNITFKKVPFTVSAGGTLVLDNGAVVTENAGAGITVNGAATAKGTLEMREGASITLNGGGGVALTGTGDSFTMSGGTISGNNAFDGGGGVALTGTDGTFTMNGGEISLNTGSPAGGGVGLWGTNNEFTMSDGTISGNSVNDNGGGVSVWSNNEFTMTGGTISGNEALHGGGVGIQGEGPAFTMSGGTISGNESARGGGIAIWSNSNATFNMSSGVIEDNIASVHGGGVFMLATNAFNMTGGAITGNSAGQGAGGAFVENAPFDMTGGEITGNTAPTGGGVGLYGSATLTGGPSIGSKNSSKGSIYSNTPDNVFPTQ